MYFIRWLGISRLSRHPLFHLIHRPSLAIPLLQENAPPKQTRAILDSSLTRQKSITTSTSSTYTCYLPVPVDSLSPPPQISSRARPTPSKMEMALLHLLPGFLVGERWRKAHQWIASSTYAGRTMMPHEQSIHACMYSYVCTFFHRLFLYQPLPCWEAPLSLNPSAAICYSQCVLIQYSMPVNACSADTRLNFQLREGLACHQKDRGHQKLGEYEK
ncbi:hypothetical protein M431DRAFT_399023 [Trichoderma harzianum CBS 226.95]|uniref:Uncharacterized protein n=1 Tax=Trichoderma harzianum CBS 226.95 TaxID=983964 RepID=A0A2T4AE44_TRIHA|nr:hypothetical protein M431DRAFT_399023 [Trichoderma harzianum CBS 226.95]PTB55351.1 hypothetical protein M431DRAFT_399023 [Trichoderma harzianum CBS 226.95]